MVLIDLTKASTGVTYISFFFFLVVTNKVQAVFPLQDLKIAPLEPKDLNLKSDRNEYPGVQYTNNRICCIKPCLKDILPPPNAFYPLQKNLERLKTQMKIDQILLRRLSVISKEKLEREATAEDPDLRRCVAHFRLHCVLVRWAENIIRSHLDSE
jgi:hypothetical protein